MNLARDARGETDAYSAAIHPPAGTRFTADAANAALDAGAAPAVRGRRVRLGMPGDDAPGPYVVGNRALTRYGNGALVSLHGDPAAESWESIQIIWHGPPGAWRPEVGIAAEAG